MPRWLWSVACRSQNGCHAVLEDLDVLRDVALHGQERGCGSPYRSRTAPETQGLMFSTTRVSPLRTPALLFRATSMCRDGNSWSRQEAAARTILASIGCSALLPANII